MVAYGAPNVKKRETGGSPAVPTHLVKGVGTGGRRPDARGSEGWG